MSLPSNLTRPLRWLRAAYPAGHRGTVIFP